MSLFRWLWAAIRGLGKLNEIWNCRALGAESRPNLNSGLSGIKSLLTRYGYSLVSKASFTHFRRSLGYWANQKGSGHLRFNHHNKGIYLIMKFLRPIDNMGKQWLGLRAMTSRSWTAATAEALQRRIWLLDLKGLKQVAAAAAARAKNSSVCNAFWANSELQ